MTTFSISALTLVIALTGLALSLGLSAVTHALLAIQATLADNEEKHDRGL